MITILPFHGMTSDHNSTRFIRCPPFYSINRERIGAMKTLCSTNFSAVDCENQWRFHMMLEGNARESCEPVMNMQNIKFNLSANICHPFFKKMVEQKNPCEKVRMPQLCRGAIDLDSVHFFVVWRAWKVQCDNIYIMTIVGESLG